MDTARAAEFISNPTSDLSLPSYLTDDGMKFSNAYATAPWTLPSHAGLFTSTYSSKHGAHADHKQLIDHLGTLSGCFENAGYETVGVSNNTWISPEFGFDRGFNRFIKNWQYIQKETDFSDIARNNEGLEQIISIIPAIFEGNPIPNIANAFYGKFIHKRGDSGAKRANKRINSWYKGRDSNRPFFLFINYLEPHLEYRPPYDYAQKYLPSDISIERARDANQNAWEYIAGNVEMTDRDLEILQSLYRAELAYTNERIKEVRDLLVENEEWEDTIFVVTGDHGENIGDHGLMDHQYCLYDTLLHVPLVIHGGAFTGGETVDNLVQLSDLGPTLLDAAGVNAPDFRTQAQGQSFHPDTDAEPREFAIAEYLAPQPSMAALKKRVGTLPEDVRRYDRSLRAIRDDEWKLIRGSDGSQELYHIADDPEEQRDLAAERPEQVDRLATALDDWLNSFKHADVSGEVDMSDDTKARLEDLGYLQ